MAIKKDQTRDVAGLSLRASFTPASVDAEKRTVDLVWSTGASVLRNGWDGSWNEELSMDPKHVRMGRLNSGAPFLGNHDGSDVSRVLGVVESARIEGKEGIARVRFDTAENDPEADKVFRKIQNGIVRNVSVGYKVHKAEKVDGSDKDVPTYRATDWEPYEISAVAMGADASAGFRSLERGSPHLEVNTMTEEEKRAAELKALELAEETRQLELKTAQETSAKAERTRAEEIRVSARALKVDEAFVTKLVSDGTPVDEARRLMIDEVAKRSAAFAPSENASHHTATVTDDNFDKMKRGVTASLVERSGLASKIEAASKKNPSIGKMIGTVDIDGGGDFRGMTLFEIAKECVERQGTKTRGMTREQVVAAAFQQRAGGFNTSSDYSILLENVMNKALLAEYALADDSWRSFCDVDSVQDFRPSNRYRIGSYGPLDHLTEAGEYKNKSIPDGSKFQITTETRGNIIAISRESVINDDLGAIADTISKFGRSLGLSIETDVYALLAQNSNLGPTITVNGNTAALCDATFGNVGSGSALSVQGIDADAALMAQQKDPSNNEFLNLQPSVLLVPRGLKGQALNINHSEFDVSQSSKFMVPNIVRGLFTTVVGTPRLSGTRRYLFTAPGSVAALKVVFLNGQQTPFMEQQLAFRSDATEWKIRCDFKVQAFDPKGILTNAGV